MSYILVGHGFLGSEIAAALTARQLEFRWFRHDQAWLPTIYDRAVINAAGFTGTPNVDECEDRKAECIAGNILWPLQCERLALRLPVVHIGSGCVYQGAGPYSERDPANFHGSFYSLTKAMAEHALHEHLTKSYILRVRMPFGAKPHPRNLLTKLAGYERLVDVENSLSCVEDIADLAVDFALHLPRPGIYNATNPSSVTTREIAGMMGLDKRWFKSEAAFLKTVKAPRSSCVLDVTKLMGVHRLRPVREALAECVAAMRVREAA